MATMPVDDENMQIASVEFTLEDTYEHLKDVRLGKKGEVKKLMNIIKNNEVQTLTPNVTPEEIKLKRLKYIQSMEKFVKQEQPKDFTIPNTSDFYVDALKELEDEVRAMEELNKVTDEEIHELGNDIIYLEKKKATFEQMKEACVNAAENEESTNYEAEMIVTKKLFQEVKKDLEYVVDTLFPDNRGFQELLCILTRAMSKGGDDLFIDVTPEVVDFVNFLEEIDIIQFHPHDKNKIKLRRL